MAEILHLKQAQGKGHINMRIEGWFCCYNVLQECLEPLCTAQR